MEPTDGSPQFAGGGDSSHYAPGDATSRELGRRQTSLSDNSEKPKGGILPWIALGLAGLVALYSGSMNVFFSRDNAQLRKDIDSLKTIVEFQKNTQAGINNKLSDKVGVIEQRYDTLHNYTYGQVGPLRESIGALRELVANNSRDLSKTSDSLVGVVSGLEKNVVTQDQFSKEKGRVDGAIVDLGKKDDSLLADANAYTDLSLGKQDSVYNVAINAMVNQFNSWQEDFKVLTHNHLGAGFGFKYPTVDPEGRVRGYFQKNMSARENLIAYCSSCLRSRKEISSDDPEIKHFAYLTFSHTLNDTWANPLKLSNAGAADKADPNWLPSLDKPGK
jgi:hypothetical protein